MKRNNLGLYIHIPFCESKCFYCDFNSICGTESIIDKYMNSLFIEIELYGKKYRDKILDTIFIGGGTPSSINLNHIVNLIKTLKNNFKITENCEITIEGNPNSLDGDKLETYFKIGINRLSIGAQSFVDTELKSIGRIHKSSDVKTVVNLARKIGFKNINLDLMMGLPEQTLLSLEYSLINAIELDIEHISCYSLILEEGTPLYSMVENGEINSLPDEDTERYMYENVRKVLQKHGYKQYEISNYSKQNFECRHNIKYWKSEDYLGLGVSAHGKIHNLRYGNTDNLRIYSSKLMNYELPIDFMDLLYSQSQINEEIIMGIRLNEGININNFNKKYTIDFENEYKNEISKNIEFGFIEIDDKNLKLTNLGRNFSNLVELDFYRLEE